MPEERQEEKKEKGPSNEGTTCSLPPQQDRPLQPGQCPYCGLRFENPPEMIRHVFLVHAS
ncbi:MAG: hypothetical protein D6778_03935 [Nitrospirae bacterium]|nr:MAG: hypothetical protein D6778_03935 [Nitrospirota bacterium]